jgi:hypothetical protein
MNLNLRVIAPLLTLITTLLIPCIAMGQFNGNHTGFFHNVNGVVANTYSAPTDALHTIATGTVNVSPNAPHPAGAQFFIDVELFNLFGGTSYAYDSDGIVVLRGTGAVILEDVQNFAAAGGTPLINLFHTKSTIWSVDLVTGDIDLVSFQMSAFEKLGNGGGPGGGGGGGGEEQ